jgi:outer membrane protein
VGARRVLRIGLPAVLVSSLAGCGFFHGFTRPEGDGGWSPERRSQEIERHARVAGVAVIDEETAATPPSVPNQVVSPLDLSTALALAARNNYRIAEARRQVELAAHRVADTRGRLLPSLTGSGRYTWYTDPQVNQVDFPPDVLPPGVTQPIVQVRDPDFGVVNGTLTLPVDLSRELRDLLRSAQAGYRGERARSWAATLDQQAMVFRSYFQLLETRRLRRVTEETIALDRQQLANAEERYRNGRLTKNELLVVQVTLRNAEQRLLQRDLAIDRARWSLNQAVGLPVNAATEVVDIDEQPRVASVSEALRLTHLHNPVLASLLEEQQRLEATVGALKRSRFPRFTAGGAIDYSTSDLLQPQEIGSGFVGFSWDLGTDTRREAQIAEALVAAGQNRLRIERQLRELEAAVRTGHQAVDERLAAFSTAQAAVVQAEENLRIRQQQFAAGRAQSEDVLDAEALLAHQRATLASALYQAHIRNAELRQLIGLSLDDAAPLTGSEPSGEDTVSAK